MLVAVRIHTAEAPAHRRNGLLVVVANCNLQLVSDSQARGTRSTGHFLRDRQQDKFEFEIRCFHLINSISQYDQSVGSVGSVESRAYSNTFEHTPAHNENDRTRMQTNSIQLHHAIRARMSQSGAGSSIMVHTAPSRTACGCV